MIRPCIQVRSSIIFHRRNRFNGCSRRSRGLRCRFLFHPCRLLRRLRASRCKSEPESESSLFVPWLVVAGPGRDLTTQRIQDSMREIEGESSPQWRFRRRRSTFCSTFKTAIWVKHYFTQIAVFLWSSATLRGVAQPVEARCPLHRELGDLCLLFFFLEVLTSLLRCWVKELRPSSRNLSFYI